MRPESAWPSSFGCRMFDLTPQLDCAGRLLKLDRPRVMGIVNVTPDSFSDGGAPRQPWRPPWRMA